MRWAISNESALGATWVKPEYVQQFMGETFQTPWYFLGRDIQVRYAEVSGQWNISGKTRDSYGNSLVTSTYGTSRANAYRLLEDALNLKDTKIYDTVKDIDGEHRVLNKKETMLAQQKQEQIREAFKEWEMCILPGKLMTVHMNRQTTFWLRIICQKALSFTSTDTSSGSTV